MAAIALAAASLPASSVKSSRRVHVVSRAWPHGPPGRREIVMYADSSVCAGACGGGDGNRLCRMVTSQPRIGHTRRPDSVHRARRVGGGREGAETDRDHLPADSTSARRDSRERDHGSRRAPRLAGGARQRAERGIADAASLRLVERTPDPCLAEVARLGAEADEGAAVRLGLEYHLQPEPRHLRRLRLLDAVAGDMRGVVQARHERPVGCREHLGLANARLGGEERQRDSGRAFSPSAIRTLALHHGLLRGA